MSDKPDQPAKPEPTPFHRFMDLTQHIMQVPKAEVDAKEAERKKKARKKKRK